MRTFNFDSDSSVYTQVAADLRGVAGWKESQKKGDVNADLWLVDGRKKGAIPYGVLGRNGRPQLVNYYRGSGALTLKSSMIRTLRTHIREKNLDQDSVGVPLTFIVYPQRDKSDKSEHDGASIEENQAENSGASSLQQALQQRRKKIAENADERAELLAAHLDAGASGGRPIWIAKSSAGGKGQGICISRSCEEVLMHVDSSASDTAWVVSRYLEQPMLIDGRKFDVRCWVLLDSLYRIHVFEDGVARTSSYQYDLKDLSNPLQHLTNHCIQATTGEYERFEQGNELCFRQLDAHITTSSGGRLGWFRDILPQMNAIITLSFDAARAQLAPAGGELAQFQLFGFDFLVDADYKVWLLEINGSPASRELLLPHMSRALVRAAILAHFKQIDEESGKRESAEREVDEEECAVSSRDYVSFRLIEP